MSRSSGKERNGVIAHRGRWCQESSLFFKSGELIAYVHADGSASVQGGRERRMAGVVSIIIIIIITGIIGLFTFGLIITKHRHYCTFH